MKNDVEKYIERRKRADKAFAKDFEAGYEQFKIGVMLREAREEAGVTQEGLARMTKTKKSAISRLENHAEDVRLSTVARVARALGKAVRVTLVEATCTGLQSGAQRRAAGRGARVEGPGFPRG